MPPSLEAVRASAAAADASAAAKAQYEKFEELIRAKVTSAPASTSKQTAARIQLQLMLKGAAAAYVSLKQASMPATEVAIGSTAEVLGALCTYGVVPDDFKNAWLSQLLDISLPAKSSKNAAAK